MGIIKDKKQIKILGAGISGLVAGITLAKNGYRVEIFEKRSRVGSFLKKDVHSMRNYPYNYDVIQKYKELGIKISNVYPIFKEFRFSPSLKYSIEIYSKNKPLFYNVIRGYIDKRSLDIELFEHAKEKGVEFIFNQNIKPDNNDMNIIATGSPYRKGIVYGYHYKNISIEPNALYFFLNSNQSSYGYSYITPFFKKEASIAIVCPQREKKEYLKRRLNILKKNKIIRKVIKNAELENEFFGFAYFKVPDTAIKNRKLYVGEAGGFLDASTGFGIHFAILSGYLAAKSIIKNENYDKLWKKSFEEELKMRYVKRIYLQRLGSKRLEKMIKNLAKTHGKRISIKDYKEYSKI